jgi:hypothetical protein
MSVATLPLDYPAIKVNRAFATLDAEEAAALEVDILDLLEKSNWGGNGSLIIPGDYLEVVITRS